MAKTETPEYFWDSGGPSFSESGSRMYTNSDVVVLEIEDFDHEDNRRYDYCGEFAKMEFIHAIRKLLGFGTRVITLKSKDKQYELEIVVQDKRLEITLAGTPSPCTTPGGSMLRGSCRCSLAIESPLLQKLLRF